jgi:hypothetical protein
MPRLDATRAYEMPSYQIGLQTNASRSVVLSGNYLQGKFVQFDEDFYGFQKRFDLSLRKRFGTRLRSEISAVQVREALFNNSHFQNRNFLITRWMYQFTPRLHTRVLAQYSDDHHANNVGVSALVSYDFTARSAAGFGYNRQRHAPIDPGDLGDSLFVKISYLFSF